jgi:hypothetical protein
MPETSPKTTCVADQNPEVLLHVPEIFVFSACLRAVQELGVLERTIRFGEMDTRTFVLRFKGVLCRLIKMSQVTQRFGVGAPVGKDGQFSPSFWGWFNFWNEYRKQLSSAQIDEIERLVRERLDTVNHHRPEGEWLTKITSLCEAASRSTRIAQVRLPVLGTGLGSFDPAAALKMSSEMKVITDLWAQSEVTSRRQRVALAMAGVS